MLEHLRQRVIEALAPVHAATLSTYGPAELQAGLLPCESAGICLYFLVPATSDHLLNLEKQAEAVVSTPEWQLRGKATMLAVEAYPADLELLQQPEAQWSRLILVEPVRLHIRRRSGWGYSETIDMD